MPLMCEIVTQDRVLYEGPADSIQAPGSIGEMGILPNHAPLLTTLAYGVLRVRNRGEAIPAHKQLVKLGVPAGGKGLNPLVQQHAALMPNLHLCHNQEDK